MQETDEMGGFPTDRNTLNKLMALHPTALNTQTQHPKFGSALAMSNYQNMLMRQNSMNSSNSVNQHEGSSPFNTSTTPGSSGAFPGGMFQNPEMQQQLQLQSQNGNVLTKQSQPLLSQNKQSLQQQMLQQFLHDMNKKNNGGAVMQQQQQQQQSYSVHNPSIRNSPSTSTQVQPPSRSNSFKSAASIKSESPAPVAQIGYSQKSSYFPESLHSSDEMVPDIAQHFIENGFFNSDLDESMNFSWKDN